MPLTSYIDGEGVRLQATPSPDPLGQPLALTGAVSPTRYVGGNASGAPLTGTFAVGDFVVNADASIFVCTVAGSPGTWVDTATVGPSVSSVFSRTGVVVAGNADYLAVPTGGLTGAVSATRFVGGTATVAPTTGTFAVGDFVIAQNGKVFICTVAGSPGTWVNADTNVVSSVFTRTGAVVAAANDYTFAQIAAAANSVAVSNLVAGTAGQVLGGTGPSYALPPGFEINYTAITTNANVTDTAESTATALISPGAITFDGTAVLVEFFCASVLTDTAAVGDQLIVSLFEGATQITRLAVLNSLVTTQHREPVYGAYRFTPTAAAHTYKVTAFTTSTTGTPTLAAGTGGTNGMPPAYVRFTKV